MSFIHSSEAKVPQFAKQPSVDHANVQDAFSNSSEALPNLLKLASLLGIRGSVDDILKVWLVWQTL